MKNKTLLILLVIACLNFVYCSPKVYPIKDVDVENTYVKTSDTLYLRDSIYIDRTKVIETKGDTVFVTNTEIKYVDKFRYKTLVDTVKVDVYKENVVVKEVEKKLNWWQKFQKNGFWILLSVIVIFIVVKILKKYLNKS